MERSLDSVNPENWLNIEERRERTKQVNTRFMITEGALLKLCKL